MKDFTRKYKYEQLIREEIEHYSHIKVTEDLKEGGPHANNSWGYYWARVAGAVRQSGYDNLPLFLDRTDGSLGRPVRVLTLGSGCCGKEIEVAAAMASPHVITCPDINGAIFDRAKEVAKQRNLSLDFRVEDLNFVTIERQGFDFILAHAALHHVINLEHLFRQIAEGLADGGVFHLVEVVGMNRKLIWDENEDLANSLLATVPKSITRNLRLDVPIETDGMEGVRKQDILPLLDQRFDPLFE